jgi:phage-related tail protein
MYEAIHLESEDLKSIEVYKTGIKHIQSMIYKRKGQNSSILMLKRQKINIKKEYHN